MPARKEWSGLNYTTRRAARGMSRAATAAGAPKLQRNGSRLGAESGRDAEPPPAEARCQHWAMAAWSKCRAAHCMRRAWLPPPKRPTSVVPNLATPPLAAWQGLGVPARRPSVAQNAGSRRSSSSAPRSSLFAARTHRRCGQLGVTGAINSATPSRPRAPAMGLPSRRTGDTRVGSKHGTSQRAAAP